MAPTRYAASAPAGDKRTVGEQFSGRKVQAPIAITGAHAPPTRHAASAPAGGNRTASERPSGRKDPGPRAFLEEDLPQPGFREGSGLRQDLLDRRGLVQVPYQNGKIILPHQ